MAEVIDNGGTGNTDNGGGNLDKGRGGSSGGGGVADGDGGTGNPTRGVDTGNGIDGTATGGTLPVGTGGGTNSTSGNGSAIPAGSGGVDASGGGGSEPVRNRGGRPRKDGTPAGTKEPLKGKMEGLVGNPLKITPPKNTAFKDPEETKKLRAKSGKVTADSTAQLMAACFYMYAQTKIPYFRQAWDYSPKQLLPAAEPISNMLNKMPQKYLDTFDRFVDPLAALMALNAIVQNSLEQERALKIAYAEMVAEQKRTSGNGKSENPNRSANSYNLNDLRDSANDGINPLIGKPIDTNLPL